MLRDETKLSCVSFAFLLFFFPFPSVLPPLLPSNFYSRFSKVQRSSTQPVRNWVFGLICSSARWEPRAVAGTVLLAKCPGLPVPGGRFGVAFTQTFLRLSELLGEPGSSARMTLCASFSSLGKG